MWIVYDNVAGLDVRKKTVVAASSVEQLDGSWRQETMSASVNVIPVKPAKDTSI